MRREKSLRLGRFTKGTRDALSEYIAELEEIYPSAKGTAHVTNRQDGRVIVSVPLPKEVSERMRVFDHMAELGTKLLLETDQYIILSSL
ncbi:MAG TPA: hypothetical protein VFC63_20795 [Blastocatellia bacterium]|nr:hypothetical protein [Blastocatellia bacterium]